jgi:hypothetical protein
VSCSTTRASLVQNKALIITPCPATTSKQHRTTLTAQAPNYDPIIESQHAYCSGPPNTSHTQWQNPVPLSLRGGAKFICTTYLPPRYMLSKTQPSNLGPHPAYSRLLGPQRTCVGRLVDDRAVRGQIASAVRLLRAVDRGGERLVLSAWGASDGRVGARELSNLCKCVVCGWEAKARTRLGCGVVVLVGMWRGCGISITYALIK